MRGRCVSNRPGPWRVRSYDRRRRASPRPTPRSRRRMGRLFLRLRGSHQPPDRAMVPGGRGVPSVRQRGSELELSVERELVARRWLWDKTRERVAVRAVEANRDMPESSPSCWRSGCQWLEPRPRPPIRPLTSCSGRRSSVATFTRSPRVARPGMVGLRAGNEAAEHRRMHLRLARYRLFRRVVALAGAPSSDDFSPGGFGRPHGNVTSGLLDCDHRFVGKTVLLQIVLEH